MAEGVTTVAGITIPSQDPVFLSIVATHIVLGLICGVSGLLAMMSAKGPGRHPLFGSIYFWSLAAIFATVIALSLMRWAHNSHLFALGTLSFAAALLGRGARRRRIGRWERMHIVGMGSSYILLLTAFYVDNGHQLPLWRDLPTWTYWTLPALIGMPIIAWALLRHPLVRQAAARKPIAS
jgi:hypothetical protein